MILNKSNSSFWRGKRVLVTGHTGFKGSWLVLWLYRLGAEIVGISLPPHTSPNMFISAGIDKLCESHFCDIRDDASINALVTQAQPEIIIHLAAQSLVRLSYSTPRETFATNIMGTVHILDAMRALNGLRVAIMITTDKVYRNNEWLWPYREDDALGGHDPYSASKAASEIVISSYIDAFLKTKNIAVATARAGNVIGGGDWSDDRLIPDVVRAWQSGQTVEIRRPDAIRPWQHVLEPLAGYLTLAEKLWNQPALAGAYNFGPETSGTASVREVVDMARKIYGSGDVHYGDGSEGPHEAGLLALEVAKSRQILGVRSRLTLSEAIERTITWYRAFHEGEDAQRLSDDQIESYENLL